jgi:hypothetical protein
MVIGGIRAECGCAYFGPGNPNQPGRPQPDVSPAAPVARDNGPKELNLNDWQPQPYEDPHTQDHAGKHQLQSGGTPPEYDLDSKQEPPDSRQEYSGQGTAATSNRTGPTRWLGTIN